MYIVPHFLMDVHLIGWGRSMYVTYKYFLCSEYCLKLGGYFQNLPSQKPSEQGRLWKECIFSSIEP